MKPVAHRSMLLLRLYKGATMAARLTCGALVLWPTPCWVCTLLLATAYAHCTSACLLLACVGVHQQLVVVHTATTTVYFAQAHRHCRSCSNRRQLLHQLCFNKVGALTDPSYRLHATLLARYQLLLYTYSTLQAGTPRSTPSLRAACSALSSRLTTTSTASSGGTCL
jgi:hypothetical protein